MKRILLFIAFIMFFINVDAQTEIRRTVSTGGSGWKRVAYNSSSAGRCFNRITIYTIGGNYVPYASTIRWSKGWSDYGGINVISDSPNGYWSEVRITTDGTISYLEVNFTVDITNLSLLLDQEGWSDTQLYNGTLPSGGGTVICSSSIGRFNIAEDAFTIDRNKNIGIGTPTPKEKLTLMGSGASFGLYDTNPASKANNRIARYPNSLVVQNDFGGTWKDNIVFADNGNVGIGTNNPNTKLSVNGDIKAKEVNVTLEGWADFVFKPNYNLRPLSEVEQFIKTNNHLPEIPSEAEVKENGIGLGEMNAKLLQKVEELTLYLIELKKENDSLKERMNKFEGKQ